MSNSLTLERESEKDTILFFGGHRIYRENPVVAQSSEHPGIGPAPLEGCDTILQLISLDALVLDGLASSGTSPATSLASSA